METLKRCKVCGLVIAEAKIRDICPACGVPKTAFEDYTEKVSAKRKRFLDIHLHPIMVHFPQAIVVFLPALLIGNEIIPWPFNYSFLSTAKLLSLILPLSAAAAAATGILDGKLRFKKLSTPYLRKKMLFGGMMILISLGMAAITLVNGITGQGLYLFIALNIACLVCQYFLGKIGVQLMFSVMPG